MAQVLEGLKVVDLSRFIAGPYCTMLLGDMGADVIKIEKPHGDEQRHMEPTLGDLSTYFMVGNRNKRSLTLNMKDPEGKKILRQILSEADVVVENFRPRRENRGLSEGGARWALPGNLLTVVSLDDPEGRRLAERLGERAFAYSEGKDRADLSARNVNLRWGRLEFDALTHRDLARVRLPLGEEPDLYSPLVALACALGLGMPLEEAVRRLSPA